MSGNKLDDLTDLIYNQIPFADNSKKYQVNDAWKKYLVYRGSVDNHHLTLCTTPYLDDMISKWNSRGQTPLYVACSFGSIEMIRLLLGNHNININIFNKDNSTPAIGCCWHRTSLSQIFQVLRLLGNFNPDLINNRGETVYGILDDCWSKNN